MLQNTVVMATQTGISENLHDLRKAHPEIDTAIFADFRAGTVLSVSSATEQPQEMLDGIVDLAARIFDGRFGDRRQFALVTPTEVLVVQLAAGNNALAVIFDPGVDLARAQSVAGDAGAAMDS